MFFEKSEKQVQIVEYTYMYVLVDIYGSDRSTTNKYLRFGEKKS